MQTTRFLALLLDSSKCLPVVELLDGDRNILERVEFREAPGPEHGEDPHDEQHPKIFEQAPRILDTVPPLFKQPDFPVPEAPKNEIPPALESAPIK